MPTPESTQPALIILLEDDRLSQRLVSKIFTSAGHEVLVVDTIADGVAKLRGNPHVDLLIVDNQVGAERGWNLVSEVRRRNHFADLHIVTYTESRDRDVVSQYARLGVQAFHLKPYRADVLHQELAKALAAGRRERFAESPEVACRRLKLTPEDYAAMLNGGAAKLEEDCQTIRRMMLSVNDPRLNHAFRGLTERLPQLGIHIVPTLRAQAEKELLQEEFAACAETLQTLDAVAAIVRRRAMDLLSMGDSFITASGAPSRPPTDTARDAPPPAPVAPADGLRPAFIDALLSRPISVLGRHTARLARDPLFPDGQMPPACLEWARDPGALPWFDTLSWLDRADTHSTEAIAEALRAVPDFSAAATSILQQSRVLAARPAGALDWPAIVEKLGRTKAAALAAAGRLGRLPAASPLPLAPLRRHTITMLLLGHDLGRLLALSHPHKLAGAAIANNIGLWTLLLADPLSAALALAADSVAAPEATGSQAGERATLGLTFGAAGARWLEATEAPRLYRDVASRGNSTGESAITLTLIELMAAITRSATSEDAAALGRLRNGVLNPASKVWEQLRALGVAVPTDTAELGDMVVTLAKSAALVAGEIVPRGNA